MTKLRRRWDIKREDRQVRRCDIQTLRWAWSGASWIIPMTDWLTAWRLSHEWTCRLGAGEVPATDVPAALCNPLDRLQLAGSHVHARLRMHLTAGRAHPLRGHSLAWWRLQAQGQQAEWASLPRAATNPVPRYALFIQDQDTLSFPYKSQHFLSIWYFIMTWTQKECLRMKPHRRPVPRLPPYSRFSDQQWATIPSSIPTTLSPSPAGVLRHTDSDLGEGSDRTS